MTLKALLGAAALTAQIGLFVTGTHADVCTRYQVPIYNDTGMPANDLHFQIMTDEGTPITGASITPARTTTHPGFNPTMIGPPIGIGSDTVTVNAMGPNHVAPRSAVAVNIVLCTEEENRVRIKNLKWTKDGAVIGGGGAPGWDVEDPDKGGDGGDTSPGGGGRGAQEDDGGSGNFLHSVTLFNDLDHDLDVSNFRLLASMTYYDNLMEDIAWNDILPLSGGSFTIPANSTYKYLFETTGAYLGGHVYFQYEYAYDSGLRGMNEDIVVGDHPVPIPSPGAAGMVLCMAGVAVRRRRA